MPKPRGKKNFKIKPILHIFCEGEKTERIYFNGYLRENHPNNRRLKVVKVEKTNKNTPVQLVEVAIELKDKKTTPDNDVFWVVYDRESKSKYSDSLHKQALSKAKAKSINVAMSNVCFELWILLHLSESYAAYSSYTDLIRKSPLKEKLKSLGLNKYEKADDKVFDLICKNIGTARERAENMNQRTIDSSYHDEKEPHMLNPYTNINDLLDAIDEFVSKA
ncbi:RloB-like protein [Marinobacterium halophilum]|uniref:RloB-like protein n=1 Tax=Marinobacterium halophilum TaxID=267374 RepID=A0A2P8EHH5_9GAMM|nr:RloB family protein [Marinobacterium halophilum]PSL08900.1 RloB-like protein [Marinobacterium halophilum]